MALGVPAHTSSVRFPSQDCQISHHLQQALAAKALVFTSHTMDRPGSGYYCSTSGTVLSDREQLSEHYRSDLHRYNLKRKVAGLPPVTKEWFEARRAQLIGAQGAAGAAGTATGGVPAGHVKVWFDPLTRKSFRSEATYQAHIRSNKYQEAVRRSGEPAPAAVVSIRKLNEPEAPATPESKPVRAGAAGGFTVVAPSGGLPLQTEDGNGRQRGQQDGDEGEDSGWDTVSEEELDEDLVTQLASQKLQDGAGAVQGDGQQQHGEEDAEEEWEQWDVRRSLFDNHMSSSFEANLEYMWRKYGFYLPDAQYLTDPEGLLKYLGAKLQYGKVPLYTCGDDANAKQFRSLHAVQRHMVDAGKCKMAYDDNEEEYSDFYNYEEEEGEEEDAAGRELAVTSGGTAPALSTAGYELVVAGAGGQAKVLGTREFARYYKQRHRPGDDRQIVLVNTMLAKYRSLGISLQDNTQSLEAKKLKTKSQHDYRWEGKRTQGLFMRTNINNNLPKNVPY